MQIWFLTREYLPVFGKKTVAVFCDIRVQTLELKQVQFTLSDSLTYLALILC